MRNYLIPLLLLLGVFASCKSRIKQQDDSVYSRHLQKQIKLSIITTPMPDNKEDMNLLLFNGDKDELKAERAKKIIDSLYKEKLIQPITLVAFEGKQADYGLEEGDGAESKQYEKFNAFVMGELYPYAKKKTVIRKFHSVAIYGSAKAALSSFDIAWNNDDKIQRAGMSSPVFGDSAVFAVLHSLRKRPDLDFWINAGEADSATLNFSSIIQEKCKKADVHFLSSKNGDAGSHFADFLVWAFPK